MNKEKKEQREIKFKQWIDGWHYWGFIDGVFIPPAQMKDMKIAEKYSCQYTGLKDKNNVEIHEGDILRTSTTEIEILRCVLWYDGGFVLKQDETDEFEEGSFQCLNFAYAEISEVIGNKFECNEWKKFLKFVETY